MQIIDPFALYTEVGNTQVYWTLQLMFFVIIAYLSRCLTNKSEKNYFKYSAYITVLYSIYEGVRWLRGADYAHYYTDIVDEILSESPEPLYVLTVKIFHFLPFYSAFIFYAAVLIIPVLLLIKDHRDKAYWMLPLFVLLTQATMENLIRQYYAIGLFLFGLYFWLHNNKKVSIVLFACAPLIHLSALLALIVFMVCERSFIKTEFQKPYVLVLIYMLLYWLWDIDQLGSFSQYLSLIDFGDSFKFRGYFNDSERWFTEEGSLGKIAGVRTQAALISRFIVFVIQTIVIYLGFYVRKRSLFTKILFWFTYYGIIIKIIAGDIEIINRISQWYIYMMPLLMGYIITERKGGTYRVLSFLVIFYYVFYNLIIRFGTRPYSGCGYLWDM